MRFAHDSYACATSRSRLPGIFWATRDVLIKSCCLLLLVLLPLVACSSPSDRPAKNVTLQQAPPARLTYVAIGASDTFGYGTDDPATQSWPVDLARKLGPGVHTVNLGIPGIDVRDALDLELPVALDAHPDLITVWLAVNDLIDKVPLKNYREDLNTLFTRLQAGAPHARIIVANVPDLTYVPRFKKSDPIVLRQQIGGYNAIIADVVQEHHIVLVDLYTQWQALATHPEYISKDGFHPSPVGYAQLAQLFYQALQT